MKLNKTKLKNLSQSKALVKEQTPNVAGGFWGTIGCGPNTYNDGTCPSNLPYETGCACPDTHPIHCA
ncbi:hypothetical protein [Pseudoalteromonas luteoviolacea]|uniref:Uncharacterized protein n=1 Tax=Pseudoalteromonas luteoviolacea S4054 TaxID=1129367 RepID=A0A0F6AE84_9GAMM|nr:hypothetical protein [Pseudoalteromonas luteoviolacea]AOT08114.1 hypothetical protein S4054249_09770 [Pseudoalteromonas luteoviolacea]AOT13031.1 hypothetical protein S40542_09770 [Pseudoalteromonas luteoviolacea]AOT17943.1 hypothetical protein S4054_09765 [Pseudoalteromonas luteoviolacea]KKE84500.1 hypothetical protein N479_08740 [Pseudoalteromonas luteoviolacea S4054]KZN69526.1 hypothetical protein N481_22300 [Pseudoalteromonas luteoviolacea S4047-1]